MRKSKLSSSAEQLISVTQIPIEGIPQITSERTSSKSARSPEQVDSALVRPEMHMFLRPYFLLDKRADRSLTIDTKETVRVNGKEIERRWCVKPDAEYGMPGPFERDVLLAIYEIAYEAYLSKGLQVPELMQLGTMSAFLRRLGMTNCGKNASAVKVALKRLVHTTCKSENSFFDKSRNLFVTEAFQLLRAVGIAGESDGNGGVTEKSFVQFDDRVRNNLNARYLMVIDLFYLRGLKTDIGKHLYPLLSHWLWKASDEGYWRVQYSWLAQHLGIKVWEKQWRARQQLDPANEELKEKGYIAHFHWDGWDILYFPGDAHKGEQMRRQAAKKMPPVLHTSKVHAQEEHSSRDPLLPILTMFAQGVPLAEPLLKQRGISAAQAQALCLEKGIQPKTQS